MLKKTTEQFGQIIIDSITSFGSLAIFLYRFIYWFPRRPWRGSLVFEQLYFIGNKSLFIIILSGSFTGMVLAYQTYFGFKLINVDSLVGPVVALSMAKELAPVISGLIVAGRAGGAMAAQIGTMRVTEQIDALEVMGINSFQYLAVPRILAGTLTMPLLTTLFNFVGNMGGWFIGTKELMIDEAVYFSKLSDFMFMSDVYQGLIKSVVFGFTISLVGTYFGFNVKKGAVGVGVGTNLAVVWGMILVLILDYFLTSILVRVL